MATSQVTGLASGIDWQETIQLIMQIESQPKVALEARKETYEEKLAAWQQINTKLLALKTAMEGMNELDEVLTKAASSSDQDILTATANTGAATGSYSVLVNQLAQSAKLTHDGFVDANTTQITDIDATFAYTYGTDVPPESFSVEVPAGTTLTELVQIINNDVDNPGISATILNEGTGLTPYHLVLSGETGVDNIIAIDDAVTTIAAFEAQYFEVTQAATNAQIRVDGYPSGTWIESADNSVEDVIAGVTLHLHSADPATTATVSISNDTDAAKDKINDFVSKYNEVITLVNTLTAYDAENETAGDLFGDPSVIGIKSSLQSIVASEVPGLVLNPILEDPVFASMSEIGVKSGAGGLLSVNSTKLDDALEEDFNAVGDLFAFTTSSTSNSLVHLTHTDATVGGTYHVIADYDDAGNLLSATINGNETQITGNLESGYYIVGLDGYPEEGLRLTFTAPEGSAGSVAADVLIGTGAAVQIENKVSFLTDPMDGTVHYAQEGIQDTIDSIDKQIDQWDARLEIKQQQLEREFLAMETMISQLQGQGNFVAAMISNL